VFFHIFIRFDHIKTKADNYVLFRTNVRNKTY